MAQYEVPSTKCDVPCDDVAGLDFRNVQRRCPYCKHWYLFESQHACEPGTQIEYNPLWPALLSAE